MNQTDIETFLMLVKTKNITKTAENLYVSQPTVSHRLKLLEDELNVPLLRRRKGYKKVELTQKGEEFQQIAERWLTLMQETKALQNTDEDLYLRVGGTNTLNSTLFKDLYREIMGDPEAHLGLNVQTHYSYELYEDLANHTIDVGFVYHQLHFKNIVVEPLFHEKMYIVQEGSKAIQKAKLKVEELDLRMEICFIWEANYQIWHDQTVLKGKRPFLEVDEFDLLEQFLKDPGRWAIVPQSVMEELALQQNVFVSEIGNARKPPERTTYLITYKDISENRLKAVEVFRNRMEEYLQKRGFISQ